MRTELRKKEMQHYVTKIELQKLKKKNNNNQDQQLSGNVRLNIEIIQPLIK